MNHMTRKIDGIQESFERGPVNKAHNITVDVDGKAYYITVYAVSREEAMELVESWIPENATIR